MPPKKDALELLLDQYGKQAQSLPPLIDEPFVLNAQIQEWVNKIIMPILDWIRSLMNQSSNATVADYLSWHMVVVFVAVVLIAVLMFYSGRVLFGNSSALGSNHRADFDKQETHQLPFDWHDAVNKYDFALAARLYWRHVLMQNNMPVSQTPLEYFGANNQVQQNIYKLMFTKHSNQSMFDEFCTSIERSMR